LVECLDRNLSRAAQELVCQVKQDHPDTTVTVLLPRRTYSALLGRLLHDRTADKIAAVVSRIPGASAQIVAYDIASRIRITQATRAQAGQAPPAGPSVADNPIDAPGSHRAYAK
jgi:DNA-binding transcriptional regulator/RsmH inhibitor MraZ